MRDLSENYDVAMNSTLSGHLSSRVFKAQSENVSGQYYARNVGLKKYELKDHLGNVRAVVSDLREHNTEGFADALLAATSSYYPFGMLMPGLNEPANPVGQGGYRFGFNGKEKDDEWTGSTGTVYDYGFRIYDTRIARFLSVDPLFQTFPMLTPYQFSSNTPIYAIDLDGQEAVPNTFKLMADEMKRTWWSIQSWWNSPNFKKETADDIRAKYRPKGPYSQDNNPKKTVALVTITGVTFYGYDKTDKKGCWNRCQDMMNSKDFDIPGPTDSRNKQMTKYNSKGVLTVQSEASDALKLIDNTLDAKKPITVGVDYKTGHTGNYDETTDHWIVIVGRGSDNDGTYYNYYDPQTAKKSTGTSGDNKLYLQGDGTLQGDYRTGSRYERTYTVTQVRPADDED